MAEKKIKWKDLKAENRIKWSEADNKAFKKMMSDDTPKKPAKAKSSDSSKASKKVVWKDTSPKAEAPKASKKIDWKNVDPSPNSGGTPKPNTKAATGPKLKADRVKPITFKKPPSKWTVKVGTLARGARLATGPLGSVINFVADATPAGAGSDKPSGPLMKGNAGSAGAPKVKTPVAPGYRMPSFRGRQGAGGYLKKAEPSAAAPAAAKPRIFPSMPDGASAGMSMGGKATKTKVALSSKPTPGLRTSAQPKQEAPPKTFQKGSTKEAYQPEGKVEKRGAVTSTKMSAYQKSVARDIEKQGWGGKSYGPSAAKSKALQLTKKR